MITQGRIQTHQPTNTDKKYMDSLPDSLAIGERESIAICKRLARLFVSNERRVMHHSQENGINCTNLEQILRAFWEFEILPVSAVREVVNEIEMKDSSNFVLQP